MVRLRWSVGWMEECRRAVGANVHDSGDHHPERRDLLLGRPPGIKKSDLQIDKRLKDVAPCIELQCWFSQDTANGRTPAGATSLNWSAIRDLGSQLSSLPVKER